MHYSEIDHPSCSGSVVHLVVQSITHWQAVNDADPTILVKHLPAPNTYKQMVAAQQNNDEQVRQTIDKCIARTMRAEVVVQKRRDQAPVAARKAVATRTQREEARNIKQFEKLKQSLQEQGVVSPDGAVINKNRKPQKTKKR